jgi:hypothetical protein
MYSANGKFHCCYSNIYQVGSAWTNTGCGVWGKYVSLSLRHSTSVNLDVIPSTDMLGNSVKLTEWWVCLDWWLWGGLFWNTMRRKRSQPASYENWRTEASTFQVEHYKLNLKLNNSVFWDVAPCGFITNRRVTCNFRVEEITRARKRKWRWRRHVLVKRLLIINPHGAISQKTAFFIVTAARTSNLKSKIVLHTAIITPHPFARSQMSVL